MPKARETGPSCARWKTSGAPYVWKVRNRIRAQSQRRSHVGRAAQGRGRGRGPSQEVSRERRGGRGQRRGRGRGRGRGSPQEVPLTPDDTSSERPGPAPGLSYGLLTVTSATKLMVCPRS